MRWWTCYAHPDCHSAGRGLWFCKAWASATHTKARRAKSAWCEADMSGAAASRRWAVTDDRHWRPNFLCADAWAARRDLAPGNPSIVRDIVLNPLILHCMHLKLGLRRRVGLAACEDDELARVF